MIDAKCDDLTLKRKTISKICDSFRFDEKSKERLMKPAPHSLFPIGNYGGSRRLIAEASKKGNVRIDLARRICTKCKLGSFNSICPHCGAPTTIGKSGEKNINLSLLSTERQLMLI